jgi:hypothetical protein
MQSTELFRDAPARVEPRELTALSGGFQRHGGLATADEIVRLMRRRCGQPISMLARWIVNREVIHFEWQGVTLLPLFQFDRVDMVLNPIVIGVVRELRGSFDDWEIALWFVTPNANTNERTPIDAFESDPLAALTAARRDRFVRRPVHAVTR